MKYSSSSRPRRFFKDTKNTKTPKKNTPSARVADPADPAVPSAQARLTLDGVVKRHPDGFGFFIPEDAKQPDVYLPKKEMQGLMSGDKVKIMAFPRPPKRGAKAQGNNFFSGKILQLIERAQSRVIGQYFPLSEREGLIQDHSFQWGADLKVGLKKEQKIKKGEWAQVQIVHWPDHPQGFTGEIICSLGKFPSALEDNIRTAQAHNIPPAFSKDSLKEAEALPDSLPKGIEKTRKDLRSLPFVTIDGKTAQDFDDAIYVHAHSKGWILYVSIADVEHYVQKNSALDQEARQRGNSTYFPGFTLPMLPEKLSNHLCSLKPNEDRLAFTAEIHFNREGEKQKALFYPAIIQSQARLTYGIAQEIMEKSTPTDPRTEKAKENSTPTDPRTEKSTPTDPRTEKSKEKATPTLLPSIDPKKRKQIIENVLSAEKLARLLLKMRLKNHFINLEIPETEVLINSLGEPMDIIQSRRIFAYQLIEELMLAANMAVAEYLHKHKVPSMYRVHDPPKEENLKFLEKFAHSLGIKVQLKEPDLQKKISFLIQKLENHPLLEVGQMLVLRSLSQAVYSFKDKHHFGLNTRYYTHWTSPIRRYSDLAVHRVLKAVLAGQTAPYTREEMHGLAESVSACEQRSVKAERQIKDIKRARFIKKFLGQEMDGTICGCIRRGFFVKLRLYDVEGMVPVHSLSGRWDFEESLLELREKSSGRRFKMGDPVSVQVVRSNIETGQIDFELETHQQKKVPKKPAKLTKNRYKGRNNKKNDKTHTKKRPKRSHKSDKKRHKKHKKPKRQGKKYKFKQKKKFK